MSRRHHDFDQNPSKKAKIHRELSISFDRRDHDRNFPNFQKPKILGGFSVDGNRSFHNDHSQLKFFNEDRFKDRETGKYRPVSFDLNCGMSKVLRKKPECKEEKIDHMLRWMLKNKSVLKDPSTSKLDSLNVDFVAFRGLLVTLMSTMYENSNDWEVQAMKFRGTIYLCAQETELKRSKESKVTPRDEQMSSWGYKFEQYLQTDQPSYTEAAMRSNPDDSTHEPVNENEEFCCMFRSRLGQNSILYGAEMDGFQLKHRDHSRHVNEIDLSSDGYFVEMKTSRQIETDRHFNTFCRYKTQKWWAQSFMVGIPKIVCGFRDDDGFVCSLEDYRLETLPKLSENPFWKPNICMNFLNDLLSQIKSCVVDEMRVYRFKWPLRSNRVEIKEEDSGPGFLPEWFLKNMFSEEKT